MGRGRLTRGPAASGISASEGGDAPGARGGGGRWAAPEFMPFRVPPPVWKMARLWPSIGAGPVLWAGGMPGGPAGQQRRWGSMRVGGEGAGCDLGANFQTAELGIRVLGKHYRFPTGQKSTRFGGGPRQKPPPATGKSKRGGGGFNRGAAAKGILGTGNGTMDTILQALVCAFKSNSGGFWFQAPLKLFQGGFSAKRGPTCFRGPTSRRFLRGDSLGQLQTVSNNDGDAEKHFMIRGFAAAGGAWGGTLKTTTGLENWVEKRLSGRGWWGTKRPAVHGKKKTDAPTWARNFRYLCTSAGAGAVRGAGK